MTLKEYNFHSKDNTRLFARHWCPPGRVKGTVGIIHGIGDHSGRYANWAECFCQQQYEVFAIDYRGHGEAEGLRGHVNTLEELFDDISAFFSLIRDKKRGESLIIYGHSMGGNLVLNYLLSGYNSFDRAIVTSPWIELVKPPAGFVIKLASALNNIVPKFRIKNGIHSSQLSQVDKEREQAGKDEKLHNWVSVRLFNLLYISGIELLANKSQISIPLLLLHGKDDKITSLRATKAFSNQQANAEFIDYSNALHELHREPQREQVLQDIIDWIEV
ncbi:alpha/beta fold hydrolase [Marinilabiliaceae bacterium JC017]|nr:alpha/beta fold hydrolase [Marinilabiliaceae bacterium JC017]